MTACDKKSVTSRQQACCKLSTDLLQVDYYNLSSTGLLQVVSTSCSKSANDKLQQAGKIDNLQQVCGVLAG